MNKNTIIAGIVGAGIGIGGALAMPADAQKITVIDDQKVPELTRKVELQTTVTQTQQVTLNQLYVEVAKLDTYIAGQKKNIVMFEKQKAEKLALIDEIKAELKK